MNSRWYLSLLIIVLTLLGGMADSERIPHANQEIVLEFSNDTSVQEAQQALQQLTEELQLAGANNIKVIAQETGQLKITYFSLSDTDSIKTLLVDKMSAHDLALDTESENQHNPSDESPTDFHFDIYEIQQGNDISNSNGKLALENKMQDDRLINPNLFVTSVAVVTDNLDTETAVAYRFRKRSCTAYDNNTHKIPEVRAGPALL